MTRAPRALPPVEFWDKETLLEQLTADICLGKSTDWTLLGQFMEQGNRSIHMTEEFSRRWVNMADANLLWRAVLEACIIRDELQHCKINFTALELCSGILRAAYVLFNGGRLSKWRN